MKTPVAFQRDAGQLGGGADFVSQGLGYSFALHARGAVMSHGGSETVTMTLAGANAAAEGAAVGEPVMVTNYYRGRDRSRWIEGLQSFERVRYSGVYDGIDVDYYGKDGQLEYDFVVKPGADPAQIAIDFSGARVLCLDGDGALVLDTPAGEVRHLAPYVYQLGEDGAKRQVAARYELRGNRVAFVLAAYDRGAELVIDPQIVATRNFPQDIQPSSMAIGSDGNMYFTGYSGSPALLTLNPISSAIQGHNEIFVMKVAPNGTVLYATFLGGAGPDSGFPRLALDAGGNAYVASVTASTDFPVSANAYQSAVSVDEEGPTFDVFVTKLSSSGSLVYSTYLGGEADEWFYDLAVDAAGHAYVAGTSNGDDFPGTVDERPEGSVQNTEGAWVAKLDLTGSATEYVTLIGAKAGFATVRALALDGNGDAYIGGEMEGEGMFTTAGVFQPSCPTQSDCSDGFVGKLTSGGEIDFLTLLGGSGFDKIIDLAIDNSEDIYVIGETSSLDFPVTGGAYQPAKNGTFLSLNESRDVFYTRLAPGATHLEYSTYLGGTGWDTARSIVVDSAGRAVLRAVATEGFPSKDELGYTVLTSLSTYDALLRFTTSNQLDFSTAILQNTLALATVGDQIYLPDWATYGFRVRQIAGGGTAAPLVVTRVSPPGHPRFPEGHLFHENVKRIYIGAEVGEIMPGAAVTIGGLSAQLHIDSFTDERWIGEPDALPAGVHDVTVTNPGGSTVTYEDAYEKQADLLTVTGVTPATAPGGVYTVLTVTGSGFPPHARVSLGEETNIAHTIPAERIDSSTLRVVMPRTPNIAPGTYDLNVVVFNGEVHPYVTLPDAFTVTGPLVTGVEPPVGPSDGGVAVEVDADESASGWGLSLDGLPATPSGGKFIIPANQPGRVDAVVSTPGGTRTFPDAFLYYQSITATGISPAIGSQLGGTAVTITGSGFLPGARVTFDGLLATGVVVESSTTITAVAPAHESGFVDVMVRNPDGGAAKLDVFDFRYDGPNISSVWQTSGPAAGGTSVEVNGSGFQAGATVWFGDVEATVTALDSSTIDVTLPAHAKGIVDVTVENPDGTTDTLIDAFRYLGDAPVIANVTPDTGVAAGGTSITITGSGFDANARVTIGGRSLLDASIGATSITGTTPPGSGSTVVRVFNPADGQSDTAPFLYTQPPTITSISPAVGPTSGGTVVTINGTNFSIDAEVLFGGTAAQSVLWEASTQLLVGTPMHSAGTFAVTVINGDGQQAVKNGGFRFLPPPPTIDTFTPTHAAPGGSVVIEGANFQFVSSVKFHDNRTATYSVNNSGRITATVPSFAETGPITITTESGSVISASNFTVDETAPEITSFTPGNGAPGTVVTITGVRFTGATSVEFGGFGGAFTVDSDTQITATVPGAAKSGPIVVRSAGGVGTSEDSFLVAPRFGSTPFTPKFGLPGTSVTIAGVNFGGTTEVLFNGVAATPFTVNGAGTSITTTVPASATTGFITVTAPGGSATTTTKFAVTPQVDSFTPTVGATGGSVVITGVRFTGATAVTFGGVAAASFTVDSDTQITAVTASGAKTGTVCVTTPGATGCSSAVFSFPPRFNSSPFSPSSSLPGTSIDINGVNFQGTTAVSFNGIAATTFSANSAGTQIVATVPVGATTGPVSVTAQGGSATSTKNFGVPPAVTSFSPSEGAAGTVVTLTGVRFTGATAVKFGTVAASSFTVVSDTQITATVSATAKSGTICVTTPGGTGCSATGFNVPPRITGFSPGSALPGAAVTINGSNFQGATSVTFFNGQAATPFTVNAAGTSITTTVPAGATTGQVTVVTPVGSGTSTSNFGVLPAVTGFTPSQGDAGTTVTITGARFTGATVVKFGGTSGGTSTSVTVNSDTQITATVPATGKSGTICVTTPGGTGCSAASFSMPPRVTGFNPDNAWPGAAVTVEGVNFHGATALTFHNGQPAPSFIINPAGTTITTTVPAGAITGPVIVTTPIGTTTSTVHFGVHPAITGFDPATGEAGTVVTITGVRLTGATAVKFGGTSGGAATTFSVVSDTSITATVPANGKSGTICVTTPGGTGCSTGSFTMAPRITSFTPTNALPGANVTITGANFHDATAVTFNGVTQPAFTVNAAGTSITTTVPATATTGPVTVTTPVGTATSATNFGVQAVVSSFTPTSGDAGTVVTITGERFTGATAVKFGGTSGVAATVFSVTDAQTISVTVPDAPKSGTLCVTTAASTVCSSGTFSVPPRVTGFSPANALPGANVTINGFNFQGATAVSFNGTAQPTFTVNAAGTSVTTTVPAGATTGPVSVTTPFGTGTSAASFGVLPVVTSFTPTTGAAGDTITITGERLADATAVKFGGSSGVAATTFSAVNATTVTAVVPATAKTGTICVTTAAGTACSAGTFTVAPRITSFTPASGLPGASVTITGLNFQGTTAVAFNGTSQPTFTVNAAGTSVTTTVPAGATTGPIAVTTPAGTATSATNFGVLPVVDGFTPSAGGPGTVVTVTGARFTGATTVKFNTTTATFNVVNDTTISATVPAAATTGKIHVTTAAGTGSSVASFTIGPKITSFTPTKGTSGTSVTINGSAFTGATAVAFNGVPAAAFTVNTSTKITATVPAGATTGLISVTTPAGGTGFSSTFFYLPAVISGFSPSSGAPGTAVTITGSNFNDASAFAFNGASAAFSVVSPTQITATVPDTATTGPLSVTTPFGPSSSASSFSVLAAPPPVLVATGSGANSVAVSWTGNAGAQFDVQRATTIGGGFTTLARVAGLSFNDLAASTNTAYLYRVIRVFDGVASNVDHTTTVVFTDDPVLKKTVRVAHLTQLRTAINALRATAGLAPAAWTDPSPTVGPRIKALHTTELRNALTPALTALGLSMTFTDPTLTAGVVVKAAHHQEMRNAVK